MKPKIDLRPPCAENTIRKRAVKEVWKCKKAEVCTKKPKLELVRNNEMRTEQVRTKNPSVGCPTKNTQELLDAII